MTRSRSLRDRELTHHGSMGCPEATFLRSHSHRAPQGTNHLLGRNLEEDISRMEEKPIIPKPSKPMFVKKSREEAKNRVPGPMELNKIFKEYSMFDPRLRRNVNFKSYLEILGLRGSSSHGPHTPSTSIKGIYNKRSIRCKYKCMMGRR